MQKGLKYIYSQLFNLLKSNLAYRLQGYRSLLKSSQIINRFSNYKKIKA